MASYVLEDGKPGYWRELGAAGLSPSTGINRLAFGDRFKAMWVSNDPAVFTRLRLGASLTEHRTDQGVGETVKNPEATGTSPWPTGSPGNPDTATSVRSTTSISNLPPSPAAAATPSRTS